MKYSFDTNAVHLSSPKEEMTGAVNVPIFQTSTFAQEAPGLTKGFNYSRVTNPTRKAVEDLMAALEGGSSAVALGSGLAAVNTVMNLLQQGDHVVACQDLYGGCYRLFTKVYRKFGVEFTFVEPGNLEEMEKALRANTRMLWMETPSNPLCSVSDIRATADLARKNGLMLVVDNTFATPYLQNPLAMGADLVVHSTSKYLSGHSDVIGGAVVAKDPEVGEKLKFYQNTVGAVPGPMDCFLLLRGVKTLAVRMDRHCENAAKLAEYLSGHPKVERVHFPGLTSHPGHEVARSQMKKFGAMLSLELKASDQEARKFVSDLNLFTLAESLGAVESLSCHPASMTHLTVEPEVRKKVGVTDGLVRLSVGIEDVDDLIRDLDQALDYVSVKRKSVLQPLVASR